MNHSESKKLLLDTIALIKSPSISGFLYHVFLNKIQDKFLECRGSSSRHHSFRGGLCYHTCHATHLAAKIIDHYRELGIEVNKDIVLAGILLHDIGKTESYEHSDDGTKIIYTKASKWFHHIPIGYGIVLTAALEYNNASDSPLKQEDLDHLLHIILSHHGNKCWSSPVIPQTLEAYIVHSIEMMDGYVDSYSKGEIPDRIY